MEWVEIPEISLYSDGGAEPNPGKGGFGVIMSYQGRKKEFSQGYLLTTNNRMELMGVIDGLERLKTKSIVNVFTDSRYVIDGIEKGWAVKWKSKNWYRTRTQKAVNADLWDKLLTLIAKQQSVKFNWVKGHAGHLENERCDELANFALNGENLLIDLGYEPNEKPLEFDKESGQQFHNKVEKEGDQCRKCNTAVIKKHPKKKEAKLNQTYYFDYYLFCPGCKTMYFVEDAKRDVVKKQSSLFE